MSFSLRAANPCDLSAIVAIYNQSVTKQNATADLDPIVPDDRAYWFEKDDPLRPVFVAVEDASGHIAGYCNLSNCINNRPGYLISADVGIYIDDRYARQGLGQRLLDHLVAHAQNVGLENLTATIFACNKPSIKLFTKNGFHQWGFLPAVVRMKNGYRDVVILGLKL